MSSYFERKKIIWGLIFLQFFYIILPHIAYSSQPTKKSYPLTPFENLSPENYPLEMPEIEVVEKDDAKNTRVKSILPDLDSSNFDPKEEDTFDKKIASGVTQVSNILLNKDPLETSIGYAKNIGLGLVNQRITGWLNQYGKARVSFNTDTKISGDFLLPIIDKENSLLFSQLGLRNNAERNTVNFGLGYRQYWKKLMYGVNTFYDYDITGGNARLGIGGETWTDYFKLAVNGYFGLTQSHQSKLSRMDDYDERPATGFDVSAEAYLPKYPQFGGSVKYEKYFGKGIDRHANLDPTQLNDYPQALSLGIIYAPIPLLTFRGEHSIGDQNNTKISMNVNYRFGVSLQQQLDPDSVDIMRSLVGNKYDFVDRNYDIVMQYSKQELINIALPKEIIGEAKEIKTINVKVNKTKYGLKDIKWIVDHHFSTDGGEFKKISQTEAQIILPPYSNFSKEYYISAVGIDKNHNESNKATTVIRSIRSTNDFSTNLIITPPGKTLTANNKDRYVVTAEIKDKKGKPLSNENITFEISGLNLINGESGATLSSSSHIDNKKLTVKTDSNGKSFIEVFSKTAGKGSITATMDNGNHKSATINFESDENTAEIKDSNLEVITDNQIANGRAENKVKAVVTDKYGNEVPNVIVKFTASNEANSQNRNVTTDNNGKAIFSIVSEQAGQMKITANINGSNTEKIITFLADVSTAEIGSVKLDDTTTTKIADGNQYFTYTAQLVDKNGNPVKVANKIIRWHQDKNTDVNMPPTSETDANGQAKIRLTSTTKAVDNVMVSAQYEDTPQREANERVSFIADISTAKIGSIELNDTTTTKIADGSQYFTYTAQLVDKNGNLLKIADKVIDWHLNKNTNVNMPSTSETDANGQAKIRLTSTTKAVDSVVVSAQYENTPQREANKRVSFIADISTARIGSIKLDDATTTKIADGSQYFTYTAQLIDDNGNLIKISNKMISWYQDKDNAVILPKTSETDANGQAKIRLTSTTKAVDNVVVSAQYESTPQREANKRVSFIADSHTAHIDSLNVDKGTATANGSDVITFTVTVKDANGNLVPKNEIAISQSPEGTGTFENLNDGKIITDANGQATFRLRSNKAENVTVTAVNDTDTTGKEKVVNFEPNDSTATIAIENDKDSGIANGSDVITFTVTIKDGNRNPFINHQLNIKTTLGGLNPKTVKTDQHGKATFTLESKKSGNATVTVTHTQSSKQQTSNVSFKTDSSTASIASLTADKDRATANGSDVIIFTVTVKDANGNLVPKNEIAISQSPEGTGTFENLNDGKITTDTNGQATFRLRSNKAENVTVTAVNDTDTTGKEKVVNFEPNNSTATIAIKNDKDSGIANGSDVITFTVTIKDGNRNPFINHQLNIKTTLGDLNPKTVKTDQHGKATFTLESKKSGNATVTVTHTQSNKQQTSDVSFKADSSTASIASLTADKDRATANGSDVIIFTVTVKDANGNLVPKNEIAISQSPEGTGTFENLNDGKITTDTNGQATFRLRSNKAENVTVTAVNDTDTTGKEKVVNFEPNNSTATIAIKNDKDSGIANGSDVITFTVTIKDGNRNPFINHQLNIKTTLGDLNPKTVKTDQHGKATFALKSKKSGNATVTVTHTQSNKQQTSDVSFKADSSTASIASLTADKNRATANGSDVVIFTVTVKDANGNLVPKNEIAISQSPEGTGTFENLNDGKITTDANGQATFRLRSNKAGTVTITATTTNTDKAGRKETTVFDPDTSSAHVTSLNNKLDKNYASADGRTPVKFIVEVKNKQGSALADIPVKITTTLGHFADNKKQETTVRTDKTGKVEFSLISNDDGQAMLHASVTDNRNDVGKKTDFDFIKYDFEINEKNRSIIVNGSFLYKVKLIPSRNIESYKEGEFVKNDLIEWVSSKPNIATINNTGLVTGKSAGITTITAKGNHDGFEFMVTSTINVKEKKFSPIYGDQNTTLHEYIIEPPTYSLVFSGGWIVDRLGTPENTLMTGGPGGNIVNVKNMNDVKSFEVTVGDNYFGTKKSRENVEVRKVADLKLDMDINKVEYVVEGVFIGQIVITYKNGLTNKIGKNEGLINHRTETYNIPDGYILQGIKVGTFGVYIQSIQFISMPES